MRSKLEEKVRDILGDGWEYESRKLPYIIESVYTPDFSLHNVHFEVKGFFRAGDAKKYKAIKKSNPDERIIFLFQNPNKPMCGAKKRKNGTILTMAEWAEKNDFNWFSIDHIPSTQEMSENNGC